MTDPATPRIDAWVGNLERRVDEAAAANRAVYFVGHSVGCQAIVRYLATPAAASLLAGESLRLGGVLCVAAWFSVVDPWATIEPWCATPIDTGAARRVIEGQGASLVVLLSDDEAYPGPCLAPNWQTRATMDAARCRTGRLASRDRDRSGTGKRAIPALARTLTPATRSSGRRPIPGDRARSCVRAR